MNEQKAFEVREEVRERWREVFKGLHERIARSDAGKGKGEKVVWGLVDGFLLYWDEVSSMSRAP